MADSGEETRALKRRVAELEEELRSSRRVRPRTFGTEDGGTTGADAFSESVGEIGAVAAAQGSEAAGAGAGALSKGEAVWYRMYPELQGEAV